MTLNLPLLLTPILNQILSQIPLPLCHHPHPFPPLVLWSRILRLFRLHTPLWSQREINLLREMQPHLNHTKPLQALMIQNWFIWTLLRTHSVIQSRNNVGINKILTHCKCICNLENIILKRSLSMSFCPQSRNLFLLTSIFSKEFEIT